MKEKRNGQKQMEIVKITSIEGLSLIKTNYDPKNMSYVPIQTYYYHIN